MNIIGIGETVYDIIFQDDQPQRAVPGGSTFNALISLGRAFANISDASDVRAVENQQEICGEGHRCGSADGPQIKLITETGDDHIGQVITRFMAENHVSTDLVTINPGTQSHISLAFLDSERNAQYEFYKDHASVRLDTSVISAALPAFTAEDYVLFGSFFAINPVIRDYTRSLFKSASEAGAVLYYDINFRKSHVKDIPMTIENIKENMRFATVVRGSAEDFGYLYGTTDPRRVYTEHIRPYCHIFICTDGGGAVSLFAPNPDSPDSFIEAQIPSPKVENVVSTIGAGDNFNAGFVFGLVKFCIRRQDLIGLPYSCEKGVCWLSLINSALHFSSHVVQRMENYVDIAFRP